MTKTSQKLLKYDWSQDIEPYLDTMRTVQGGYTTARRGVVKLADGTEVFVKMAMGDMTQKWLRKEITVYQKLNEAGYPFIPQLLAYDYGQAVMAIEYLDDVSFDNVWDKDKLDAILHAQQELKKYKSIFSSDAAFTLGSVIGLDSKWPSILKPGGIELLNKKFATLGVDIILAQQQVGKYQRTLKGWRIKENTLVHQDIRADNFGYNPYTKQGKLIDWNWLCIGDESLDRTPLFVNMYLSHFNPYVTHPEKYDANMLIYLISFWLERILSGDETSSEHEFKRRKAQAESVKASLELLEWQAIR